MRLVYIAVRLYPYWALALVIALVQTGIYFRRKNRKAQHICWAGILVLILGIGAWLGARGDLNADRWVQAIFGIGQE